MGTFDPELALALSREAYRAARAELAEMQDKALRYDLDVLGIEQRTAEAIELVELRAELAEKDARIERLTAALGDLIELADNAMREADARYDRAGELAEARSLLSGTPTTKPQTSTQTAKLIYPAILVPVERLREIEWIPTPFLERCPSCRMQKDRGHSTDCWLATALREEKI